MVEKILFMAMENKKPVQIIYNKDGEWSQRLITVLEVGNGIVKAYCHKREAYRVFKIDSIMSAQFVQRRYNKRQSLF